MIYIAELNWLPTNDNPFTGNGLYGDKWSSFIYDENIPYGTNVYENAKLYTVMFPLNDDKDNNRLFDFLSYETSYGRNVILKVCNGLNAEEILNKYYKSSKEIVYRNMDYPFMVHSTTLQNWDSIQKDNAILSPNELKKRGKQIKEIGLKALLEPDDYSDYIMLDRPDGCGEIVVNSRNLGYICLDSNCFYTPGIRMYFDVKKLIRDKIIVRDGLHILKIKDRLPLNDYLVSTITAKDFSFDIDWTPTLFTKMANQLFFDNHS